MGQLTFEWRYIAVFLLALSQAGSEIAIMGGFMFSNIDLAPQYSGVLQVTYNHYSLITQKMSQMIKFLLQSFKGISNTIGTIPGFVSPIVIAYLTPSVKWIQFIFDIFKFSRVLLSLNEGISK